MLHQVISTEKVPLVYRVAGIGSRFVAWLVDLGVLLGMLIVVIVLASTWERAREGLGNAVVLMFTFLLQWGYFVLFEWLWHGQTPGKRLVGIRVIDWQGTGISLGQSLVRNIFRVVDGLPLIVQYVTPLAYGVGFLAAASNREQRRLGDLAAGTLVVLVESKNTALVALRHEFGGSVPRQQLFRQRLEQLSRPQKETLLDLCLRRDQLRPRERTRLFAAVADYFHRRLEMPPAEHQSDEKFVLELAAALTADFKTVRLT